MESTSSGIEDPQSFSFVMGSCVARYPSICVRSLLNTITNHTSHELFSKFHRRSPSGKSLPAWLTTPGPVLLRKFVQAHKNDDLVEKVQLMEANPTYTSFRFADGRESTVSVSEFSPCPHPPAAEERQPTPAEPVCNHAEMIDIPAEIPAEASNKVNELPLEEDVGLDNFKRLFSYGTPPPPPPPLVDHHEKPRAYHPYVVALDFLIKEGRIL